MIRLNRSVAAAVFAVLSAPLTAGIAGDTFAQDDTGGRATDLPLPRFVSLKSDEVNVRRGPGQEYEVAFTFVREGLPVEIVQEFDNWRKIRDAEGAEGWVFHSLLSGKRTALVAPWKKEGQFPARGSAGADAAITLYVEPRVVTDVDECTGGWCHISVEGHQGWIEQERLWGVYPDEEFED